MNTFDLMYFICLELSSNSNRARQLFQELFNRMKQSPESFLDDVGLIPLFNPRNHNPISYRVIKVISICTDDVAKIQRKLYPMAELADYERLANFRIHKISATLTESIEGLSILDNPYYNQCLTEDVKQKILLTK